MTTTAKLPPITERRFQSQVEQIARIHGWLLYHTWLSVHSPHGFPDLVMVRNGRLIFAELKAHKGKLRHEQEVWLWALSQCHRVEVYTWRPADWPEIVRVLGA